MSAAASTPSAARPSARPLSTPLPALGAETWAAVGITAIAAALRFSTLGVQSFWKDEAFTVVKVLHPSLSSTLSVIPHTEATPPLYYLLAWGWTRVFGTGEVGLRSLSALAGTATVVVVYLAASRLASRRAGLVAASIAAFSPYLIWFSQEGRSYALLAFMATLSFLLFLRARDRPTRGALAWWAVVSGLALATHYFAVFTVVPEALWLVWELPARRRAVVAASAFIGACGAALLPLAIHQEQSGHDKWIHSYSLSSRVADNVRYFLAGPSPKTSHALTLAAGVLALAIVALLVFRTDRDERRRVLPPLTMAAAALAVPLALYVVGFDFFFHRNQIAALPLLLIAAGVVCSARRARRAGALVAAGLCAVSLIAVLEVDTRPVLQRADWRAAARAIGPAPGPRAIVAPALGNEPLELYVGHRLALMPPSESVVELDLLGWAPPHTATPAPPAGFALAGRRRVGAFTLIRYRAQAPTPLARAAVVARHVGPDHADALATAT